MNVAGNNQKPNTTPLLTPADVGRRLGVGAQRVRQLAVAGKLNVAARTENGTRLFTAKDVDEFVRGRDIRRGTGSA